MANVRRSARINKAGTAKVSRRSSCLRVGGSADRRIQQSPPRRSSVGESRNAVVEPRHDVSTQSPPPTTTDNEVLSTPTASRTTQIHLAQLSALKTPQTEPRPERSEMHPKSIHQTTSKVPDPGLRFGFVDISKSIAQPKTPSKTPRSLGYQSVPRSGAVSFAPTAPRFEFGTQAPLSVDAQKMMESVRAEAEQIKAQMIADKLKTESLHNDVDAVSGSPRKIASAKGKASRFSDIHMEQFRRMDSIENHPSAFRARPLPAIPASNNLKRKSSRADLDDPERPRTAGRQTPAKVVGNIQRDVQSHSPLKASIAATTSSIGGSLSKRIRQNKEQDVSTGQAPQHGKSISSTLFSPTKSSLARAETGQHASPRRPTILPRSSSLRSNKTASTIRRVAQQPNSDAMKAQLTTVVSPMKFPRPQNLLLKPLPPTPTTKEASPTRSQSTTDIKMSVKDSLTSKLPSFSSLKSILRSGPKDRKAAAFPKSPRRQEPASIPPTPSAKKVDFTPSVKSRHAVKLATDSPSPAKIRRDTPYKDVGPLGVPYDSTPYLVPEEDEETEDDDEVDDVVYPTLPPISPTTSSETYAFAARAKELNHRESHEFKSIFTDLRHKKVAQGDASALTIVNTTVNRTNPTVHAERMAQASNTHAIGQSTSTIRRVRNSGNSELIQPYESRQNDIAHATPGKKRRHDSVAQDRPEHHSTSTDQHRQDSAVFAVPGAWTDTILEEQENEDPADREGDERKIKRARTSTAVTAQASPMKSASVARQNAIKNAKERKGKGFLSLSRLNLLSRPKSRG